MSLPHLDNVPSWVLITALVLFGLIAVLTIYGAIRLVIKLVRTKRHLGELGTGGQVAFWGAILFTILPCDILPDPIYLDDMAVLAAAAAYLGKLWRDKHGKAPLPTGSKPTGTSGAPGASRPGATHGK